MLSIKKSPFVGAFLATLMIFSGCSAYNSYEVTDTTTATSVITSAETEQERTVTEEITADLPPETVDIPGDIEDTSSDTIEDIPVDTEAPLEQTAAEDTQEQSVTEETAEKSTKKDKKKSKNKKSDKKSDESQETAAKPSDGIEKNGSYTSPEDVAEYIHTFGTLPGNFITKKELKKLGWSGGDVYRYADGKSIGGDRYGNYEGLLPDDDYKECDVNYTGGKRGAERLVFSDDKIFYTNDHYETFTQLY